MSKPGENIDKSKDKSNIPILGKAELAKGRGYYEVSTPALHNTLYKVVCPKCEWNIIFKFDDADQRVKLIKCERCYADIIVNAVETDNDPKTIYDQGLEDAVTDYTIHGDKKEETNYRYDGQEEKPATSSGNNPPKEGKNQKNPKTKEDPATVYAHDLPDDATNLKKQTQKGDDPTIYAYPEAYGGGSTNRQEKQGDPPTRYAYPDADGGGNTNRQKKQEDPPTEYDPPQTNEGKNTNQQKQVQRPPQGKNSLNRQPESDAKLVWWSRTGRKKYILHVGKNHIGRRDEDRPSDLSLKDEHASARSVCIEVTKKYSTLGRETYEYQLTVERATNSVLLCGRELRTGETVGLWFGDTIVLGKTTLTLKKV